jgi:hypothetical protein
MSCVCQVLADLQKHRRGSAAFAGKEGFITLRDLFRYKQNDLETVSIFNEINFILYPGCQSVWIPQKFYFLDVSHEESVLSLQLNLRDKCLRYGNHLSADLNQRGAYV